MIIKEEHNPVSEYKEQKIEIDPKYRKCTMSKDMQKLMLRQLVSEMRNHNVYRSFASYYGVRGFSLLEEYYNKRAQEEMRHHDTILNYLSECDVEFVYPEIPKVYETWDSLEKPFDLTVDLEIQTTAEIKEMVDLAFDEHDYFTWNFLMGYTPEQITLYVEQLEEEATSRTARDIAHTNDGWLTKEKSILNYYNKHA